MGNTATNIRTESNLVEVVTVKEKPDRDPQEKTVGTVTIWQEGGRIDLTITDGRGTREIYFNAGGHTPLP